MKHAPVLIALIAIIALLLGGVWRHEAAHAIRFVGLTEGEDGVHPSRVLQVAFNEQVPWKTAAVLTGPKGQVETVAWRMPDDRRMLLTQGAGPLDWATPYRLCITRQRREAVQRVVGPRESCISFRTQERPAPEGPADAPVLVVTGPDAAYGAFYGPILRAEGFTVRSIPVEDLDTAELAGRQAVVLASSHVPAAVAATVSDWVEDGGLLVATRPSAELLSDLGVASLSAGTIHGARLTLSPTLAATGALSAAPIRLHGPVKLFQMPAGAGTGSAPAMTASGGSEGGGGMIQPLGSLSDLHGTPLPYPAGVLMRHGGGMIAALPFSIAETVVLSRQGNPRWIGQNRDGSSPRRANDLFFPDHVDLDNMHIPQADEIQRLLANIIVTAAPQPMPRLWYLPDRRRAVVVLAGDDHATPDGTARLFDRLLAESPADCELERWDCLRASSYITPDTPLDPADAAEYARAGFELGVHVDSGCRDRPDAEPEQAITEQMEAFRARYAGVPQQETHRLHCVVWSGWTDVPRFERAQGVRLDLNYYSWPPHWLEQRAGFMTGSGFPMPFLDEDGRVMDIYQAATHMVNEDGVPQDFGIASLLDRALGPEQYFGAFAAHVDYTDSYADRIIRAARARGVALISARQMLRWLDGRNASVLHEMDWDGTTLHFAADLKPGAERATILLPHIFGPSRLATVLCNGRRIETVKEEIKGIAYSAIQIPSARCEVHYGVLARAAPAAVPKSTGINLVGTVLRP